MRELSHYDKCMIEKVHRNMKNAGLNNSQLELLEKEIEQLISDVYKHRVFIRRMPQKDK